MSIIYRNTLFHYPRRIAKYFMAMIYPIVVKIYTLPKIKSIEETLLEIINNKKSISRFGDGEFMYLVDKTNLPFQVYNENLAKKLREILVSNQTNHLVGLPVGLESLDNLHFESKLSWKSYVVWTYPRLKKYLDLNKVYYNASMTRVYAPYDDKSKSKYYFELLMKIWEQREVLLIEGCKSRLGVGNNLFEKTKSIRRVLAPKHHAYDVYNSLLECINKESSDVLILCALGPTATALTYDASLLGYQAVDIGNVDLEYEWYLRKATQKVKIQGKYTSEAKDGRNVEDLYNAEYLNQIIADFSNGNNQN